MTGGRGRARGLLHNPPGEEQCAEKTNGVGKSGVSHLLFANR